MGNLCREHERTKVQSRKFLVLDTETGGLDAKTSSILSIGLVVWNNGGIDDELYIEIAEPDIQASPEALKVNGINLDDLRSRGDGPLAAVNKIEAFLQKNDLRNKVYIAGHNVIGFDIPFVKRLYSLAGADFNKRFSYHMIDTMVMALCLDQVGRLGSGTVSLDKLCGLFKIDIRGTETRHNALQDAKATAKLLSKLLDMIKNSSLKVAEGTEENGN